LISSLKQKIVDTLTPIITNDYIYLDLPYYRNIGDILIWKGTEEFLSTIPYRCLYQCAIQTYHKLAITEDKIIIIQGGGNFGDLWRKFTNFCLKILHDFPYNKIVIMPKTVYYLDKNILLSDADLFSKHRNLIICAREENSYKILQEYFTGNTVYMLPDMAFCISQSSLKKLEAKQINKALLLKRTDKELNNTINYSSYITEKQFDILDWPTKGKDVNRRPEIFLLRCFLWANRKMPILFRKLTDIYALLYFKSAMIKTGVRFISKYEKIYTTRLHAAILCCLLERPCVLFDNTYGKNSSFYKTWLSDFDNVALCS